MLEVSVLWLVTKDREVLLQKRALTKRFHPGEWGGSFTETAEEGETPDQTLARGATEELGLTQKNYTPHFLLTTDFLHADDEVRRFSIYGALVPKEISEKFVLDPNETSET